MTNTEDCFLFWYNKNYPDLDPTSDEFFDQLRSAYFAGWDKCTMVRDALDELIMKGEEFGEYND